MRIKLYVYEQQSKEIVSYVFDRFTSAVSNLQVAKITLIMAKNAKKKRIKIKIKEKSYRVLI